MGVHETPTGTQVLDIFFIIKLLHNEIPNFAHHHVLYDTVRHTLS
jgi:hypothetical protein